MCQLLCGKIERRLEFPSSQSDVFGPARLESCLDLQFTGCLIARHLRLAVVDLDSTTSPPHASSHAMDTFKKHFESFCPPHSRGQMPSTAPLYELSILREVLRGFRHLNSHNDDFDISAFGQTQNTRSRC